jgi:telomerase reverse transcriptase
MRKRLDLLHELLYYVFDSLLIPLLRTNFYATESAAFRNRTLYFRQDDWRTIALPLLEKLKEDCFTTISKNEAIGIMSGRDFGYSFVRLLPKQTGVRPIVNLRRRSVKIDRNKAESNQSIQQQQSINNILNATFHVLNYEKGADEDSLGSSVFGAQEIYEKLKAYKSSLLKQNGRILPRLYFVKVDVACAFDSIDQEKLLEIVKDVLRHDRYVIQKFSQVMSKGDRAAKEWPRLACPEEDHEDFATMVGTLGRDYKNVVFSDGVIYTPCERESLMGLLEEHITNNLIKIGKVFCKQRVGIPQGSSLSTLLCCYYLAKMERDRKLCEAHDTESLLMRYTDDFLFISSSQDKAKQFYESMKRGDASFNVNIAVEKSMHNLEVGVGDEMSRIGQDKRTFPWCSYVIKFDTLSTEYDMSRYANSTLSDTLTINNKRPFQALAKLIQSSIKNKSHCIFLDVELNGIDVVVGNLYRNFLLTALKVLSYHRQVKRLVDIRRNDAYIHQVIMAGVHISYSSIKAKMNRSCKSNHKAWQIDQYTFTFLALDAFSKVFRQRAFAKRWIAPLQAEIRSSKRIQMAQRLQCSNVEAAWMSSKGILASVSL